MKITKYVAKRKKKSWSSHTKSGKPVIARAKAYSWNVSKLSKPSLFHGKLKGGLSEGKDISSVNRKELEMGIKVEMEHTTDKNIAREIALDHLQEDSQYYTHLKSIEKKYADPKPEIKGQQLRIRVQKPVKSARYATKDVGRKGRLQLVLMNGELQSLRFNLDDYKSVNEFVKELQSKSVRRVTTPMIRSEAFSQAMTYYNAKGMKY